MQTQLHADLNMEGIAESVQGQWVVAPLNLISMRKEQQNQL